MVGGVGRLEEAEMVEMVVRELVVEVEGEMGKWRVRGWGREEVMGENAGIREYLCRSSRMLFMSCYSTTALKNFEVLGYVVLFGRNNSSSSSRGRTAVVCFPSGTEG